MTRKDLRFSGSQESRKSVLSSACEARQVERGLSLRAFPDWEERFRCWHNTGQAPCCGRARFVQTTRTTFTPLGFCYRQQQAHRRFFPSSPSSPSPRRRRRRRAISATPRVVVLLLFFARAPRRLQRLTRRGTLAASVETTRSLGALGNHRVAASSRAVLAG